MNALVDQFWARSLKIAHQYDAGELVFADLTGLSEEFAASLNETLGELPEPIRSSQLSALEAKLQQEQEKRGKESPAIQEALNELLVSITRTPIY